MESLTVDDHIRSLAAPQLIPVAVTAIARRTIYEALNLLTMKVSPKKGQEKGKQLLFGT
jgi:hypothetical protein